MHFKKSSLKAKIKLVLNVELHIDKIGTIDKI